MFSSTGKARCSGIISCPTYPTQSLTSGILEGISMEENIGSRADSSHRLESL